MVYSVQTMDYPLQKLNQEVAIFLQSSLDEESITSKMFQVHAKLQPTYFIIFTFKKNSEIVS